MGRGSYRGAGWWGDYRRRLSGPCDRAGGCYTEPGAVLPGLWKTLSQAGFQFWNNLEQVACQAEFILIRTIQSSCI
jgi:hypothetical protein